MPSDEHILSIQQLVSFEAIDACSLMALEPTECSFDFFYLYCSHLFVEFWVLPFGLALLLWWGGEASLWSKQLLEGGLHVLEATVAEDRVALPILAPKGMTFMACLFTE